MGKRVRIEGSSIDKPAKSCRSNKRAAAKGCDISKVKGGNPDRQIGLLSVCLLRNGKFRDR